MPVGGAMGINMKCVMYFIYIKSDGILDLYLDFYFTYECKYKESLSSLLEYEDINDTWTRGII
jgi:hypothetical protein